MKRKFFNFPSAFTPSKLSSGLIQRLRWDYYQLIPYLTHMPQYCIWIYLYLSAPIPGVNLSVSVTLPFNLSRTHSALTYAPKNCTWDKRIRIIVNKPNKENAIKCCKTMFILHEEIPVMVEEVFNYSPNQSSTQDFSGLLTIIAASFTFQAASETLSESAI